jgi:hypothetical protein
VIGSPMVDKVKSVADVTPDPPSFTCMLQTAKEIARLTDPEGFTGGIGRLADVSPSHLWERLP